MNSPFPIYSLPVTTFSSKTIFASVAKNFNVLPTQHLQSLVWTMNAEGQRSLFTPADTYFKSSFFDFEHCGLVCVLIEQLFPSNNLAQVLDWNG